MVDTAAMVPTEAEEDVVATTVAADVVGDVDVVVKVDTAKAGVTRAMEMVVMEAMTTTNTAMVDTVTTTTETTTTTTTTKAGATKVDTVIMEQDTAVDTEMDLI